ncbi:hypothetical protein JCM11641_007990 [Rhodosporidiobolus odoratus]
MDPSLSLVTLVQPEHYTYLPLSPSPKLSSPPTSARSSQSTLVNKPTDRRVSRFSVATVVFSLVILLGWLATVIVLAACKVFLPLDFFGEGLWTSSSYNTLITLAGIFLAALLGRALSLGFQALLRRRIFRKQDLSLYEYDLLVRLSQQLPQNKFGTSAILAMAIFGILQLMAIASIHDTLEPGTPDDPLFAAHYLEVLARPSMSPPGRYCEPKTGLDLLKASTDVKIQATVEGASLTFPCGTKQALYTLAPPPPNWPSQLADVYACQDEVPSLCFFSLDPPQQNVSRIYECPTTGEDSLSGFGSKGWESLTQMLRGTDEVTAPYLLKGVAAMMAEQTSARVSDSIMGSVPLEAQELRYSNTTSEFQLQALQLHLSPTQLYYLVLPFLLLLLLLFSLILVLSVQGHTDFTDPISASLSAVGSPQETRDLLGVVGAAGWREGERRERERERRVACTEVGPTGAGTGGIGGRRVEMRAIQGTR